MPEWIWTIKAAKFLGISPVELEQLPAEWKERALLMVDAEAWAENEQAAQAKAKAWAANPR